MRECETTTIEYASQASSIAALAMSGIEVSLLVVSEIISLLYRSIVNSRNQSGSATVLDEIDDHERESFGESDQP